MSDDKPRPFLTRPAVIDWLQWNEFPEKLGEPNYPQLTLSLIEEYRLECKRLAAENKRMREALEEISKAEGSGDKIACLMTIGFCAKTARKCLESLKGGE